MWAFAITWCPLTFHILIFFYKTGQLYWTKLGKDDPWEEEIKISTNEVDPLFQRCYLGEIK